MLVIRRIATVAVMVYLLLALLFIITAGARDAMMALTGNQDPASFWYVMTLIGAALLLLLLLTENAYNVAMRRDISRHELKVNELKAKLYDHQLEQRDRDVRPVAATTVPRPEPAPGAIARGSMTPPATPYSGDDHPTDHNASAPERPLM
ncbi:hypothetical protein [Hymenobacter jeollabukensis]|uniref:Uncharacterized protein n=1 Tax=Hymenobacter jeollabukensis TaxID=2025313 RepID=A0A5R8WUZ2_9BACT|nr:hypothetical protein [Hymenobacter jeollabukensis]TLM95601.1 hypothetical protein FDY95_07400 [Hymenobacter jeollabukensis]